MLKIGFLFARPLRVGWLFLPSKIIWLVTIEEIFDGVRCPGFIQSRETSRKISKNLKYFGIRNYSRRNK